MTRTVHTFLGSSPLSGKSAIDQTRRFKEQLVSLQPKPEHVALLTVTDPETSRCTAEVLYDADDPDAAAWVRQAEAVSAELWQKLAARRKGAVRE